MKISPNEMCPCGSEKKYKKCCRSYHQSLAAPNPLLLMRSRYSAYALGKADYIIKTTHPENPEAKKDPEARLKEITQYCAMTTFEGLRILNHQFDAQSDEGIVEFIAQLVQSGKPINQHEKSLFKKHNGVWLYVRGLPTDQ